MEISRKLFDGLMINRNFPVNIQDEDKILFEKMQEGLSKEVRIQTFRKVTINNELFIKQGMKVKIMMESFGDTWQNGKYNRPLYQLKSYIKNLLRPNKPVDRVMWCFDQFSTGGYFHWITEISPRLWLANKHIPQEVPLLVPEYFLNKWKFAKDFLEIFNRKVVSFHKDELVHVRELLFVGQTGGPFNYQPVPIHGSTEFLKDQYYDATYPSRENLRIYISRGYSGKRMVLNELEVIELVKRYGYEVCHAEKLSLKDQINLFSRAMSLVSIHGAGLSNMVFMPRGSNIIEIRHRDKNHMLTCFYTLAHTFGHHYYYSFGNDMGDSLNTELRPEDKSIHADLIMLENVLRQLHEK